ncbi:MAG: prephenate dehydrogenase [Lachnospiraceae bacterium]|nr:prephenate dehydrogenase [Robinsoniella sp.]MDY3766594.1 prephenate dehydrogenase [Lachnospiraceae bacterium]
MSDFMIGFIGLGLIGGSIAKAIRYATPSAYLIAHTRSRQTMDYALENHIIDEACEEVDERFSKCDFIFLCAPVESNASYLKLLKPLLKESCILTDVGSTKTDIHQKVSELGMEKNFIGGHPMAGSEKTGIANSKRILLENAYYVLTPTEQVSQDKLKRYYDLVLSLKALPLILTCQKHDFATAAISHLPHVIAASLVNLVKDCDFSDGVMKRIAAGGFKDITRIASSSPEMWEQICSTNEANIVHILDEYIESLLATREALADHDTAAIHKLFADAREYRDSISDTSRGPLPKSYSLYCDMVDEAGGIASLATILATNGISIKNIGIVHNREFEDAVLHVEFYEQPALKQAVELLRRYRYTIYER